jgi:manganese/iron transport system permease protein/iron/zinc/copper transport system permease protein
MDFLLQIFWAPLTETYFQKALIGGCIVAVVAAVVGCLVVLRRMAFLGDALSHAMIAGVAGGYLVMKLLFGLEAHALGMLLGSLLAAVLTVALIGFVSRISRVKEDTAIGIMYTGIFALGVVVVSVFRHFIHIDLMHFIMGDILGVADSDLWVSAFVAPLVLTLLILFYRHFQLSTFDPVMAASIGLPVLLLDYLLTTCVSLVVVSAVSMVGVILVVGLLITPAATAYLLCDRLDRMMLLAALFGVTSVVGGLYLCVWLDSAGGGAIMLFCTLQFLVVLTVAPRYGLLARWLRLRRLVPQQVVEDVLTTILRHENGTPLTVLRQHVPQVASLPRALRQMTQDGLIQAAEDGYRLTEIGQREAAKVLRAHRLWETYLESIGTPQEELHATAHQLEHLRAGGTVDYLDEKLGQPRLDPHGKSIPPRPKSDNGQG